MLFVSAPLDVNALDIVAVEEHWELQVGMPDAQSSAPQVSMVVSPTGHLEGCYFVFTLNHHNDQSYYPGGMQVQQWYGDQLEYSRTGPKEGVLVDSNEVITWVQKTSIAEGITTFEILDGNSASWGSFGGEGGLRITTDCGLDNLNEFRPAISIEQSGVSYAGNRVASLVLRRLRWVDSEGQIYELTAPIDVDTDLDP